MMAVSCRIKPEMEFQTWDGLFSVDLAIFIQRKDLNLFQQTSQSIVQKIQDGLNHYGGSVQQQAEDIERSIEEEISIL